MALPGAEQLVSLAASFLGATIVLRLLLLPCVRDRFMDHPNERSLHARSVPRAGGVAILLPVLVAGFILGGPGLPLLLAGGLAAVSLADDWKGLPAGIRLIVHTLAAAIFVGYGLQGSLSAQTLLLVLAVIWMTNLYNFMDGADGLAGGMAVFGFTAYGLAAHGSEVGQLSWAIALSAAAFLLVNFPPAKMFMGDVGSVPLGFLAASLGLAGWHSGLWPLWFPAVAFAPFVLDASATLLRRALKGERLWKAHRSHYYQRMVLMGWSHRRLAVTEYILMAASATTALLALQLQGWVAASLLGALAVVYVSIALVVDGRWRQTAKA